MKKFLIGAALAGAMVFGGATITFTSAQGSGCGCSGPYYSEEADKIDSDFQPSSTYGRDIRCQGSGSTCLMFGG
jgi:hypothetical protein